MKIDQTCPLFGTKVPCYSGEVGEMEKSVLDSYSITKEDFECPKMPRLGGHGLRRAMRFHIWDTSAVASTEGVVVEFFLLVGDPCNCCFERSYES